MLDERTLKYGFRPRLLGIAFRVLAMRDGVYRKIYNCLYCLFRSSINNCKRCDHRATTVSTLRFIRKEVFSSVDTGSHQQQKHSRTYASMFEKSKCCGYVLCCALVQTRKHKTKMVFWVPNRTQGCMVDALTLRGDEGRGVAAISVGEACSNL